MTQNLLPVLIGALVGGIITMLGWIANYYFGRKKEIETRQQEAKLHYLQQQIEELYAPLWSLVEQSRVIHEVARKRLPVRADGLTDRSKFTRQDNEIFMFFNENYYLQINSEISEILRKKVYLLRDGIMPESYTDFIHHQVMNESLYRLWKEKGIDSSSVPGRGYPIQFNEDVKTVLDDLRQQYFREIALTTKSKKAKHKE
jgi:hypothetical protein